MEIVGCRDGRGDGEYRELGRPFATLVAMEAPFLNLAAVTASLWIFAPASIAQAAAEPAVVDVAVPADSGALAPNLARSTRGVLLTWLAPLAKAAGSKPKRKSFALRMARLEGHAWTKPVTIRSGADFFANWADLPSVVEAKGGALYAHWLQFSGIGTYDYDVMLARSVDGKAWEQLGRLHTDKSRAEHGFVSLVPDGVGVRGFWLDGGHLKKRGTMALMTRLVGATAEGSAPEEVLDADVCTCCQTGAVQTSTGPLLVYRDHAKHELRDISFVRRTKDGWTAPKLVHRDGWRIPACPVNGPAVARTERLLAVAWYSGASASGHVAVAFSNDDGKSFAKPIVVDDAKPVGRVAIACLDDTAIVCWLGRSDNRAVLRLRRVTPDGSLGKPLELATLRGSRSAGFPRLVRVGDELVVVWREVADGARLRSAIVPLAAVGAAR